jgi:hypothetical protein
MEEEEDFKLEKMGEWGEGWSGRKSWGRWPLEWNVSTDWLEQSKIKTELCQGEGKKLDSGKTRKERKERN